jgi:phenylpropionate dioxygenase-like ring-hydroxylating dioxygenase large terminal subunit
MKLSHLVKDRKIHHRLYSDPEIFELEMEHIFGRIWLFIAHESQLPEKGDFCLARMGRTEVLVVRQKDGGIKVLKNSCSHRGTRLCAAPHGHTGAFVCPYHNWAFNLDGSLKALPHAQSYDDKVCPGAADMGLAEIPRVAVYRGFIFASMAAAGPSLEAHLGPLAAAIDNLVERAPNSELTICRQKTSLVYQGNWKFHHENANDTIHPSIVHESSVNSARTTPVDMADFRADNGQTKGMMLANGLPPQDWAKISLSGSELGHSFMGGFYRSGLLSSAHEDDVAKAYRTALEKAKGKQKASDILAMDRFNNLIWPNFNVNAQFHQIRVVHPLRHNRTLVEGYCFRLGGAPDEIFRRASRFLTALVSPTSMIFGDDMEIFERVQKGLGSDGIEWLDMSRGLSMEAPDDSTDGQMIASETASELPIRSQMQAWTQYMGDLEI